jgi:hypothetical protein
LSGTSVVSLHCLSECISLRRLRLSDCEWLADGAMHSLTGLPALCDLDLRGSKHLITATLLDDLARISGVCLNAAGQFFGVWLLVNQSFHCQPYSLLQRDQRSRLAQTVQSMG